MARCTYPVPVEATVVQNRMQIFVTPYYNRLQGTCHSACIKRTVRKNVEDTLIKFLIKLY